MLAMKGCGDSGKCRTDSCWRRLQQPRDWWNLCFRVEVDEFIRSFYFERGKIPHDLEERKSPDPDSWGKPYVSVFH